VNWAIDVLLDQKVIDSLNIFILAGVSCANDDADADCVLVNECDGLFGVNHVAVGCAIHILRNLVNLGHLEVRCIVSAYLLVNVEVSRRLLPADLDGAVHDNIRLVVRLALRLSFVLPALLHGQDTQHDGLGGADGAGAHSVRILIVSGDIEEACDHGNAAVLDIGRDRILLILQI